MIRHFRADGPADAQNHAGSRIQIQLGAGPLWVDDGVLTAEAESKTGLIKLRSVVVRSAKGQEYDRQESGEALQIVDGRIITRLSEISPLFSGSVMPPQIIGGASLIIELEEGSLCGVELALECEDKPAPPGDYTHEWYAHKRYAMMSAGVDASVAPRVSASAVKTVHVKIQPPCGATIQTFLAGKLIAGPFESEDGTFSLDLNNTALNNSTVLEFRIDTPKGLKTTTATIMHLMRIISFQAGGLVVEC